MPRSLRDPPRSACARSSTAAGCQALSFVRLAGLALLLTPLACGGRGRIGRGWAGRRVRSGGGDGFRPRGRLRSGGIGRGWRDSDRRNAWRGGRRRGRGGRRREPRGRDGRGRDPRRRRRHGRGRRRRGRDHTGSHRRRRHAEARGLCRRHHPGRLRQERVILHPDQPGDRAQAMRGHALSGHQRRRTDDGDHREAAGAGRHDDRGDHVPRRRREGDPRREGGEAGR